MDLYVARYVDRWIGLPLCLVLHALAPLFGRRLPPLGATTPPGGGPRPRPRRVLGMKFYGLGNIVMILPVLRELRAAFPDVEIEFLTLPSNADLLRRSALVDRVHTLDVSSFPRFVRSVVVLMRRLRERRFDAVLDFEQFMKVSGVFAFMTGAAETIGLDTEGQRRGWLYSTRVSYTDSDHTTDIFLRLIAPFGVQPSNLGEWRLPVPAEDVARVHALLAESRAGGAGPLVVVHAGNGPNYKIFALKRWEASRFAAVADALIARHGARVVLTGHGPDERALVDDVSRQMRHPAIDACDRLDGGLLAALLSQARVVLSNDTGVMHLAGAVGTPVAAIFGPTSPRSYGPRGPRDLVFYKHLYCSPCISNYNLKMSRCTDNVCLKTITVEEVLAGIEARWFGDAARTRAAGG
jgi:ADP-heptose:LPS heptosyltransferase